MKKVQAGFTLIELMIVVAIIGILAAIAIPQYQTYISKSQVTRAMGEAGGVKTAIELCLLDGKTAFGNTVGLCDPGATPSSIQATGGNTCFAVGGGACVNSNTGYPTVAALTATSAIVVTFGNGASGDLKAGPSTLTWTRTADGSWGCLSTAAAKYRPANC